MDLRQVPLRSALFTPATRPERVGKLPGTGTDLGVVDLEDAVAPTAKGAARAQAREACRALLAAEPAFRLAVRVNAPLSEHVEADVAEALVPGLAAVVVPKVESADDLARVRQLCDDAGLADVALLAGIESALGVLRLDDVLAPGLASAAYFGAEDYVSDLGGERTAEGREVLYARSHVALVARVHGVPVLDQIVPAYDDDDRFRADAAEGRSLGYGGKLCIHPRQVALALEAFTPSADALDRARRLVAHYEEALDAGVGVVTFDGQMVDQPMLRHARSVLSAAGEGS
ncbi:HpcH/HpaI aldolase/citrate lyase family protein [Actinomarinicola tropica]|uniref:CoA ester lyase n=1 Tax=Actinomarinicola tropica TaxID=2789776 RepID=A0A5Q2RF87_9ACTN|nr:CoA ester lyase [Actinomarinicola tropica]QGG94294.1 CoA ester lyase [Actinomarinicola tropica]